MTSTLLARPAARNCGRQVRSLRCGHCGSHLPAKQAGLYGAVVSKLAKLGGNRVETTNKGDGPNFQNTRTPPSLCRWIYERLSDAGVSPQTILDPCAGDGNLTRPFQANIIEYEIQHNKDFFKVQEKIACDLVLCNPPWSDAERWLRHIVEIVGNRTPIVFICPIAFFSRYKGVPCRKFLESADAPRLNHVTALPADTFVGVYELAVILWLNLPAVHDVALVPSRFLIRKND